MKDVIIIKVRNIDEVEPLEYFKGAKFTGAPRCENGHPLDSDNLVIKRDGSEHCHKCWMKNRSEKQKLRRAMRKVNRCLPR